MRNTNPRPATPGTPGHPESLWLVGGNVVDVVSATVRKDTAVELYDGTIRSIVPNAAAGDGPRLDLGGRYITPGLVSVHTHFTIVYPFEETDIYESAGDAALRGASRARDALLAGVTTVRTLDEHHRADILIRRAAEDGWLDAPRIIASGRAIGITGGHGQGREGAFADGADGFLKAAREELAAGADHIKVFISGGIAHQGEIFNGAQMTREEMAAAVRAASERGTYVVAHAGGSRAIKEALEVGITHFEHGYELDADVVDRMAAANAYLTPTLSVTSSPDWMRAHGFTEWQIDIANGVHPMHLQSIQRAFSRAISDDLDADGIRIVSGTDYLPGEPHAGTSCAVREMEYLEQAGLPAATALRAGTWEAARMVGGLDRFGAIEEGLAGDVVLTTEDPTVSVSALRTMDTVVQAGRIVRTELPTAGIAQGILA